ncbi:hypothetical protein ABIA35_006399 [Catenulispora sp. MAP12-49]|uniref:FHA domain-containing protein n=1 Tax=unclassified Catenulispora TaxID=414885 RepID=UPI003515A656
MNWCCPECGPGEFYGDDDPMCPVHMCELIRADHYDDPPPDVEGTIGGVSGGIGPGPAPDGAQAWDRSRCWNCGSVPPDETNVECLDCHRALTPPRLLLRFPAGEVELEPGASAELGRVGPYARIFRNHPNVSRRHAVVGVDADGTAWIRPLPTPNGTFLDGSEIPGTDRHSLRDGHRIRLALHAEGLAAVYAR